MLFFRRVFLCVVCCVTVPAVLPSTAVAQQASVTVLASGPARPVVVIIDGQGITVQTVPLAGPMPPPGPPSPAPQPPAPTPITGVVWVQLVADAKEPAQQALRTHPDVRGIAKAGSVELRTYTSDDPQIKTLNLDPWISKTGLPLLLLHQADGKVLDSIKATDAASVTAAVRRYKP